MLNALDPPRLSTSVLQNMKRILLEAFSAVFLTFGAISVLVTVGSISADFKGLPLHKGQRGGLLDRLPTPVWGVTTVLLLGIAFYINSHARRLRSHHSESPPMPKN
jgi:hypothetical protein